MSDGQEELPETPRLPEDAERLGLTPLTAPGLQVASALTSRNPRARVMLWTFAALVALIVAVCVVAVILSH